MTRNRQTNLRPSQGGKMHAPVAGGPKKSSLWPTESLMSAGSVVTTRHGLLAMREPPDVIYHDMLHVVDLNELHMPSEKTQIDMKSMTPQVVEKSMDFKSRKKIAEALTLFANMLDVNPDTSEHHQDTPDKQSGVRIDTHVGCDPSLGTEVAFDEDDGGAEPGQSEDQSNDQPYAMSFARDHMRCGFVAYMSDGTTQFMSDIAIAKKSSD